ncbi:MAG: universal stress protein [Desulfatirhabdiaceae bacterium]
MNLLVYSDGHPSSIRALQFAAYITRKLDAELAVITVRSGTHATEPPPPFEQDVDMADRQHLSMGLQILADALDVFSKEGLLEDQSPVRISELSNGQLFVRQSYRGKRIPFYVCFGHMIETLNQEIDNHHYDLLVVAPPQRGRLHKMVLGDTSRKLVLDLHTSVLIVRGGAAESRFVACADGSPAARRQFPMLKHLLPMMAYPLELIWIQTPDCDEAGVRMANHCLDKAGQWLTSGGHQHKILRLKGDNPAEMICTAAGDDAIILLGGSMRHDVYRRLVGSLPIQILARTTSSVLVVKGLPEGDPDFMSN